MTWVVAVLGATGLVGREMIATLERRNFPVRRLVALASERSAGTALQFRGDRLAAEAVTAASFEGVDVVLMSAGALAARQWAPRAASCGALVIDNSSAWRMHPEVPLVVPEVNPHAARNPPIGIIANPNCSTIQLVVALKPLHDVASIEHIVVSTYQSVSGKGHRALQELWAQTRAVALGQPPCSTVFPAPIAMNLLCDWKAGEGGYSEEEWKMVHETRKILDAPNIAVSATAVRVPVACGHAESVYVRFRRPLTAQAALDVLRHAPGVSLCEQPYAPGEHPQPIDAAGTDPVYVGRVRQDPSIPEALNLWIVADNVRKGAALNAVQIAEHVMHVRQQAGRSE